MKKIPNLLLIAWSLFFLTTGCEGLKNYHESLIATSLISEVPTLIGNLAGSGVGVPFLLFSCPTGYAAYPNREFEDRKAQKRYEEARTNWIAAPLYAGSYSVGIILGTPFYPLALLFPRDLPQKKQETPEEKKSE